MATKKTTKKAATKKTPKAAASSKPPRAGRKSAQTQVFDEMAEVPEEPTSTGEGSEAGLPTGEDVATFYDEEKSEPEEISPVEGSDDEDDSDEDDSDGESFDEPPGRTRYLECELSKADIDEKRAQREGGDVIVEKLEAQLAGLQAEAKTIKTRIDGLLAEGKNLSKVIRSGKEFRNVPCEERRCENDKGVAGIGTVRLDTFEQIEWRELSLSERQGRLFT